MNSKKIISAMLITTMITTTYNTNVFAGGDMSVVSINCGGIFNGCHHTDDEQSYKFDKETGHLTLLGTYTRIGPIAPQYTNEIRTVTIECGVKRLVGTFQNCYNLTSVYISDTLEEIGENAFVDCKELKSITIPSSVTEIGARAFKGCTSLESVKIPANVTKIGEDAFKGCKKLKKVTISNSSTEIDENAFDDCPVDIISPKTSLDNITPPNVTSSVVSYSGINDINGQTPITLPPNIVVVNPTTNITPNQIQVPIPLDVKQNTDSNSVSKESISNSKSTETMEHSDTNEVVEPEIIDEIIEVSGCEFNVGTGHLIISRNTENKPISEMIPSISQNKIKSVTIRDGVTKICDNAFYGCSSLQNIIIPKSMTSIGKSAFENCTNLTSINIPNSVRDIGQNAFFRL